MQYKFASVNSQYFSETVEDRIEIFSHRKNHHVDENRIAIFLSADYGNLGDTAITLAMTQQALSSMSNKVIVVPVNRTVEGINLVKYKMKFNSTDKVWLIGGGNFGSKYDMIENARRMVLSCFANIQLNEIKSFAQSVCYFTSSAEGFNELHKTQIVVDEIPELILAGRGSQAVNAMQSYFPSSKIVQETDAVLANSKLLNYLFEPKSIKQIYNIGICLRNDKESILSESTKSKIIEESGFASVFSTHLGTGVRMNFNESIGELSGLISKFHECKTVITDRLHGMIFAYLSGIDCIVLSSQDNKIKDVYYMILEDDPNARIKYVHQTLSNNTMHLQNLIAEAKNGTLMF